jgi:hypothetical protein
VREEPQPPTATRAAAIAGNRVTFLILPSRVTLRREAHPACVRQLAVDVAQQQRTHPVRHHRDVLFFIVSIVLGGLIIGALGRLVIPGPNRIGCLDTQALAAILGIIRSSA